MKNIIAFPVLLVLIFTLSHPQDVYAVTPSFSVLFPLNPGDAVCTPLIMNTNVASTESWYVRSAGGSLGIEVTALAVNSIDPETVTIMAFDPANNPAGTTTISYPPGTPAGSAFSSFLSIPGTTLGDIYRIDVITPATPPTQPHYALDFYNATEAGISSPTFASLEEEPAKWILNVNPAENLDIDFFTTGVPTPATIVTYKLTNPIGGVTNATIPIVLGNEISIGAALPGAWILEVQNINGHFRLDKPTGIDNGIYVSGMSTPECNLPDLKVTKIGPQIIPSGTTIGYLIQVENIGYKTAQDVGFLDTIPTEILGLNLVSAGPGCGPLTGGHIQCNLGNIPVDGLVNVVIELSIPPGASGTMNNYATANSVNFDPNLFNNNNTVSTVVVDTGSSSFCSRTVEQFDSLIIGTESNNVIVGTSGANLIAGLGGDDRIWGKGGDDCIFGGEGSDYLIGGTGNDEINGENGFDKIWGQLGIDILYGSLGNDRIAGGADNDSVFGQEGFDFLWGQAGDDALDGGTEFDGCVGGIGIDTAPFCEIISGIP